MWPFLGSSCNSRFTSQAGWKDAIILAEKSRDPEDGMQQEFIGLIEKARKIYGHQKRKKVNE